MLNLLTRFAKGLQICSEANLSKVQHQDWRSFGRKSIISNSNSSSITKRNEQHEPIRIAPIIQTSLNCARPMSIYSQSRVGRFLRGNNNSISGNNDSGCQNFSPIFSNNGKLLSVPSLFESSLKNLNGEQRAGMATLLQMHLSGPHVKKRPPRKPLDGNPQMKGVVLKTLIKKPKKPNSANRKCVLVRLSNGKEKVAYVPGMGHNLQEHNIVLCRVGRLRDVPGVKIKCVRGKYDLPHVQKIPTT